MMSIADNMEAEETSRNIPWGLVSILAAINLIRPLLSIAGLFDDLRPAGPIVATAIIAIIWVGIAVFKRLRNPILVLAAAGAVYAVASILLAVIIRLIFPGAAEEGAAPLLVLLTAGLVSSIALNALWGAFLGLIARVIMGFGKRA
jgi:hypothetical protein